MVFIGFGFLMCFLRYHSWTAVGYNFLIAAWCIQITILMQGFWHIAFDVYNETGVWRKIQLDIPALILGDFGAACVLVSFGAILGRVTIVQLWVLATLEIFFYTLNEALCVKYFRAVDMGGSMYIHTFGAFFGVACTFYFEHKRSQQSHHSQNNFGGYNSQMIAMIGTLFLFCFWPSFNGALAIAYSQQRVIVNTVLAITASTIAACSISRIKYGRLSMEVVLNATLAGGVAVGSASDLVVTGAVAMTIGAFAGIISAAGFIWIKPALEKAKVYDTCGVLYLHGLPGVLGGLIGAISAASAGDAYSNVLILNETFPALKDGRTVASQGWYQIAALLLTLAIASVSGIVCGLIASKVDWVNHPYTDQEHWEEDIDYDIPKIRVVPLEVEESSSYELVKAPKQRQVVVEERVVSAPRVVYEDRHDDRQVQYVQSYN